MCLRVRLRLLTAGLLLLRAAGGTAEEAAAAAVAAKEGGGGGGGGAGGEEGASVGIGGVNGRRPADRKRQSSLSVVTGAEDAEEAAKLSRQARLKLLRRACGTLEELDDLEESLRRSSSSSSRTSGGVKRGPGVSVVADGMHEAEGDRSLRANLAGVCVSIMEEMTVPRGYLGAESTSGVAGEHVEWGGQRDVGGMAYEVGRIVREEKVRPWMYGSRLFYFSFLSFPSLSNLNNSVGELSATDIPTFRLHPPKLLRTPFPEHQTPTANKTHCC